MYLKIGGGKKPNSCQVLYLWKKHQVRKSGPTVLFRKIYSTNIATCICKIVCYGMVGMVLFILAKENI